MKNNHVINILVIESNPHTFRAFSDAIHEKAREYGKRISLTCVMHLAQAKLILTTESFSVIAANTDVPINGQKKVTEALAGLKVLVMRMPRSNDPHILLYHNTRNISGLGTIVRIKAPANRRATAVDATHSYTRLALLALDLRSE